MGSPSTSDAPRAARGSRPRVVLVGPAGGHTGGVAMMNDILLGSRLRERYEWIHLDTTRGGAGRGKAQTLAPINFLYFARQAARLGGVLAFRRPAILHQPITASLSFRKETLFLWLARRFGVRTIGHLQSGAFPEFYRRSSEGGKRGIARTLHALDRLIVLSEGGKRFLHDEVDAGLRIEVVPTTVDPAFASDALRIERGPRTGVRVLMIARLGKAKGLIEALSAAPLVGARHPEAELRFAGEVEPGTEIEAARAHAEAGGNVRFLGSVDGASKLEAFRDADLLMLPSHWENLPIAVLEAMAAGLPIVATPVGALPELLEEGRNALFVPIGDHVALARAIGRLAGDPALRAAMGEANRALFRASFLPEAVIDRIDAIYADLLLTSRA